MRVRGKSSDVVVWIISGKLIEHQEGIGIEPALTADAAAQLDACAIGGLFARNQGFESTWLHALA